MVDICFAQFVQVSFELFLNNLLTFLVSDDCILEIFFLKGCDTFNTAFWRGFSGYLPGQCEGLSISL